MTSSTSVHWPHQGELCRRAYLLTLTTPFGWHQFNGSRHCVRCHQPFWKRDELCREFLTAIPAVTSEAHDAPVPAGRLF